MPQVVLEDLVKIGTTAPSGTNSQSWNFVILPTRGDVQVLGGMVADYYRKLNRLAENPLLRFMVRIIGGDSLGRYYRRYHDSVAEALREWDEKGTDRLFHGAVAAILVTGRKRMPVARLKMLCLLPRTSCWLPMPWVLAVVLLVLLLRRCAVTQR